MENNIQISLLEFLPVSIFGAVMGLCGLSFAWRLADSLWHLNLNIGEVIGAIAILLFILLSVVFIIKFWRDPVNLVNELNHPVSVSFYATIIISLLLIPGLLLPYFPLLATIVWVTGAIFMLLFAWYVLRKWLDHQQLSENALPVWIIPIVGTLDVPIVGNHLQLYGIHEICIFFYGVGFVFAIILLTIIISRLMFQPPLPQATQPTLLILTGPLALAFSGYESLTGMQDTFATVIFNFNLFLFALLVSKIILLPKVCPFFVSWWSVSFPMAAVTISALHYIEHQSGMVYQIIAGVLLLTTTAVISFLGIQTLYRIFTGTFVSTLKLVAVNL
ncbi:MAG: SLAC1 anion channel family protein [Flavipsychrobacter sp.]|nr:SLAC1 anion channel family protein [Flavipsychrobacter sp.]